MKIHPVGAELFYADRQTDRQTDRHDEPNSRFSQFCRVAEKPSKSCKDADLLSGTSAILAITSWLYSVPLVHKCQVVPQITTDSVHML